jgi:sugar O-acyltransferase (sialic acid O-acetyltransferase NeuD family)
MSKPVIIFGASGLGRSALEIFKSNDVVIYGFLDDEKSLIGTTIEEISVLGKTDEDEFLKILGEKSDAFLAYDDNKLKAGIIKTLREKREVMPVNAVHKTASVALSAGIHYGNMICQNVTIGANCEIKNHCILHAGVIVDFDAKVGDFVQIGAGSIIGSNTTIKDGAFIGSGVTIISGVTIGENARIGAGSVVISSVKDNETVFGNPAKPVG